MQQISPIHVDDKNSEILVSMRAEEYLEFRAAKSGPKKKNVKKGLAGIRELFRCSQAQAFKIAHSDWFQPAKVQIGKFIAFDADLAWELAQKNSSS
mgnify:CR=1 FL=1